MSNFTKKAIKEAFWELIAEYPLKQISVRLIVEKCGINRNSFYYHFHDIPSLIEEIVIDAADSLIQKYPSISSFDEATEAAFNFTVTNKKAIQHIYNSVNRDIYEQYLMRICEYIVTTYFNTVFGDENIEKEDKDTIILVVKCELFGLFIDWINTGMPEKALVKLKQVASVSNGMIYDMIKRCKNGKQIEDGAK